MKKFKWVGALTLLPIVTVPLTTALTGCSNKAFLDYADGDNYVLRKTVTNARYDVIFLVGTSNMEATQLNGVGFDHDTMKIVGWNNYAKVGSQFTDVDSNVFVPLYRQMALFYALDNYKLHNDIINDIANKEPYQDLKAFFDYYFSKVNINGERPFVIAGHSQGAASVQVVLEKYFINGGHKAYLKNMVAAYAVGYGVSKKWFDGLDKKLDGKDVIKTATGETDYNCLISWNTEGEGDKGDSFLLSDDKNDTYVINPINWKIDTTEAKASDNSGILLAYEELNANGPDVPKGYYISTDGEPGEKGKRALMDAKLDLERGSVICTSNTDYVSFGEEYDPLWGGKSLHLYDGSGYYVNIANNMQTRITAFLNNK